MTRSARVLPVTARSSRSLPQCAQHPQSFALSDRSHARASVRQATAYFENGVRVAQLLRVLNADVTGLDALKELHTPVARLYNWNLLLPLLHSMGVRTLPGGCSGPVPLLPLQGVLPPVLLWTDGDLDRRAHQAAFVAGASCSRHLARCLCFG